MKNRAYFGFNRELKSVCNLGRNDTMLVQSIKGFLRSNRSLSMQNRPIIWSSWKNDWWRKKGNISYVRGVGPLRTEWQTWKLDIKCYKKDLPLLGLKRVLFYCPSYKRRKLYNKNNCGYLGVLLHCPG